MRPSIILSCQRRLASILSTHWMPACAGMTLLLLAHTAHAAEKNVSTERTQETIPVGENRFLIAVGSPSENQVGYTLDMIKVEDGIPFYIPLFMEEFDPETATVNLGYGVAFEAITYHYDKDKKILDIRCLSPEASTRYDLKYTLDDDIFHLQTATSRPQKCTGVACKVKQLYPAKEAKK